MCSASRLATGERIAGSALVFFLQIVREKGELRIELSHPFLSSAEFKQEAVHIGDNRSNLRTSAIALG